MDGTGDRGVCRMQKDVAGSFSVLLSADWPRIVVMYTVYILTDLGACVCVCAPAYIYSL